jgi:hypothetical protein
VLMDPVTDDEVTLTSVRRIMARGVHNTKQQQQQQQGSPSSQSHQYQQLQPSSNNKDKRNTTTKASNNSLLSARDGEPAQQHHRHHNHHLDWLDEEKSDTAGASGGVFRTASSSDYDTDGDISKTSKKSHQSNSNTALDGPSQSQATDVNEFFATSRYSQAANNNNNNHHNNNNNHNNHNNNRRMDDDDRTFDYGDRDDDSNGSASYETRRRKEAERRAREAGGPLLSSPPPDATSTVDNPLINKDDVEHYTKSLDTPGMKLGAGVFCASTVGCLVLGPVGLLVGAAAVGIGMGIMQIPEEERNNLQSKAQKTMHTFHDKAVDASDSLSTSCASTYKDSGVADHLPQCLSGTETDVINDHDSTRSDNKIRSGINDDASQSIIHKSVPTNSNHKPSTLQGPQHESGFPTAHPAPNKDRIRNKKVACLRNGEFPGNFARRA